MTPLEQALAKVARALRTHDALEEIGQLILDRAVTFFEECPEDFCLQHYAYDVIVFGGTNRLIWSVEHGFRVDPSYCSSSFLAHAKKIAR